MNYTEKMWKRIFIQYTYVVICDIDKMERLLIKQNVIELYM